MCNLSKGVEEQGIQAMIDTLKKLQIPTEIILAETCENFGLTKEEAGKYLNNK